MKSRPHAYDPSVDVVYDKDSNPNVYLTDSQVESAFARCRCAGERDVRAREYVSRIESAHRQSCQGLIPPGDAAKEIELLNRKFQSEFGVWIYQTRFGRDFYSQFSPEE